MAKHRQKYVVIATFLRKNGDRTPFIIENNVAKATKGCRCLPMFADVFSANADVFSAWLVFKEWTT